MRHRRGTEWNCCCEVSSCCSLYVSVICVCHIYIYIYIPILKINFFLKNIRYLLAENHFSRIVVYEQRSTVGGLWNYTPCDVEDVAAARDMRIPQTKPYLEEEEEEIKEEEKRGRKGQGKGRGGDVLTPVYSRLETNIPRDLMGFSDLAWKNDLQLFPKHEDVLQYLKEYAEDVLQIPGLVECGVKVVSVELVQTEKENSRGKWEVTTTKSFQQDDQEGEEESKTEIFDAVICASGHYDVPYIPSVPGIEAWNAQYPNRITHSKFYRLPENYTGKKVIVVGNSASGVDIGAQVAKCCKGRLIMSSRSESFLKVPDTAATKAKEEPRYIEKPEIVEYLLDDEKEGEEGNRSVKFSDGTIESHIDAIIYCTGYFYSYPFLEKQKKKKNKKKLPPLNPPVITTGERVENLFQHIFYRPQPTLSFVGLNQKVIPFPMAQAQAAVIARVLSGRLALPDESAMKEWEEETLQMNGSGRGFHVFAFPKDAEHLNFLHDWAMSAEQQREVGKAPPVCGEKLYWIRERFPSIKKAFADCGEERHQVRFLEEIGYDFLKWKEEQKKGEHVL